MEWTEAGLRITQTQKYGIRSTLHLNELDGIREVHEFVIGPYGRLYVLDAASDVWLYDSEYHHHEKLFPSGHGLFGIRSLLAVIGDTLLVADPERQQCSAYAIGNSQTYWSLSECNGVGLYPIAAASDDHYFYVVTPLAVERNPDGDLIVPAGTGIGIVKIDRNGHCAGIVSEEKWVLPTAVKLHYLYKRFYVAVSKERSVYVFDSEAHTLRGFSYEGEMLSRMFLPSLKFAGLAVDSMNQLYIGDSRHIADEGEDDRFVLNLGETGEFITKVPGSRGKADKLMFDARDRMYILNAEEGTVTVLELQPRTMERMETGALEGICLTTALDSTEAETVWHKMVLEADIPDETQLRISYFCSDQKQMIIGGRFMAMDDFLRDPSRDMLEKSRTLEPFWSAPVTNPKDALFFDAKGRYMWLKIEWIGSERKTPCLSKLRVVFPRSTYLSHLPAVYQEDSTGFTERFLALFGTMFDSIETQVQDIPRHLDSDLTEGPYLKWLGSWLGIEVDEHWSDEQIRRFIREAPQLYRYRGTRRGIEKMVEIYTGSKPFIVEYFQYKMMRESSELRELTDLLYGMHPCSFSVLVTTEQANTEKQRLMLERMLNEHKPAFTDAHLIVLQPWMYLDMHTYLEVNTLLSEPSLLRIDPNRSMPSDTIIVDVDRDRRLDLHTRLGLDSEME
ncbi:phage tail protein [Paenibacillus sp. BC26]|uniref:phage tail protein n=1 Tax=Paenibacillus sp. BC26 TaxID=1881032 RepID=UPI0008E5A798|nr:phage tail protein [Paenibacillus sp. BC26]SFS59920.1 phage tail protein domain-containing protein [Paenibacillus sp. BC26]